MGVVALTGGNGFVGGRIARRLLVDGHTVRAVVRTRGAAPRGTIEHVGSFLDADTASELVEGADAVVHAAATVGADLELVRRVNHGGTRTVLDAALAAGLDRYVHVSTCSVYERSGAATIDEDAPLVRDGDPYSTTKAEAEREVSRAADRGLTAVILRPPAVLGWSPTSTWGQVIPAAIGGGECPLVRHPGATFAWVHVDDLADAAAVAVSADVANRTTLNVIGGHATWGDYVDRVLRWYPDAPAPIDPDGDPWTGRFDGDRLTSVLGLRPSRTFDEGMTEAAPHHR